MASAFRELPATRRWPAHATQEKDMKVRNSPPLDLKESHRDCRVCGRKRPAFTFNQQKRSAVFKARLRLASRAFD